MNNLNIADNNGDVQEEVTNENGQSNSCSEGVGNNDNHQILNIEEKTEKIPTEMNESDTSEIEMTD